MSGFNNRYLFLTILKGGKSKFKVLEDLMTSESWLPGFRYLYSMPSCGREQRVSKVIKSLLVRALIPVMRTLLSGPKHLLKPTQWRVRF